MSIGKKIRFEVFKRDSFTCQYCGKSAPDVILHVDHIQPASKGGDDDITNLITACAACNLGKGANELGDDTVIQKRKAQLDELQERREQLEMMVEWHKELLTLDDVTLNTVAEFWNDLIPGYSLNDHGLDRLRKLLKKYSVDEILSAMRSSSAQYLQYDGEGNLTHESTSKAFDYIGRICNVTRRKEEKPYLTDLYYIRGIVRNRMYCNEWKSMELLESAYLENIPLEDLRELATGARNWTEWRSTMEAWIADE